MHSKTRDYTILVVENNKLNLELLLRFLMQGDYRLSAATSGARAIKICNEINPDLILMDVQMPEMDGFETTKRLRENPKTSHIPIIFTSTLSDTNVILKCFECGGVDYISKPFKKKELLARINTHLSLKVLREQLQTDRDHLMAILHNMLPDKLIESLKNGSFPEPESVNRAAVLFTDFQSFSSLTKKIGSKKSVDHLNLIYYAFDEIVESFGLERVKTIGDAYFAVGGINTTPKNIYLSPILAGLKMHEFINYYNKLQGDNAWLLRMGFTVGPVTSGVIGYQKIAYDVWGDTVNFANELETKSYPGNIAIPEFIYNEVSEYITVSHMDSVDSHAWGQFNIYHCNSVNDTLPPELRHLMQEMNPEDLINQASNKKGLLNKIFQLPGNT